jgi:hypothetical protein
MGANANGKHIDTLAVITQRAQRPYNALRFIRIDRGRHMKTLLNVAWVLLLCSCAAAPTVRTSFNGNSFTSGPTSADDPRLRSPQFYMNDDKPLAAPAAAPQSSQFRAIDNFCAANCQASHQSLEYCNRICGI